MSEEHRHTVQEIILRSEDICLTRTVPVERSAHHRLREVEVRLIVSPLTLSLDTCSDGIMSDSLFLISHVKQFLRTVHQVADNHHRLHGELPVLIFLLTVLAFALTVEGCHRCSREERTVFVIVMSLIGLAEFLHPLHSFLKLLRVEDVEIYTTKDFHQRHIFSTHTQILL